MEEIDTGKEALEKLLEQAKGGLSSEADDVPPSPSSEESEKTMGDSASTIDEEAKEDDKCKVMVDYYLNQLEDMEHKVDLYNFWFMDKVDPTLKNLNTEYNSHRSQLIQWNDEGRDGRVTKVLDMLHNVYLMTSEHVLKPRKSTRLRNQTAKAKANSVSEVKTTTRKCNPTKKKTKDTPQKKRTHPEKKPKSIPPKKRSVGRETKDTSKNQGNPESAGPPKKRIYRGRDRKEKFDQKPVEVKPVGKNSAEKVNPPTPPEANKKPIVLKNGTLKRSVYSRPTSVPSMKDNTSRNKFQCCAKHMKELQYCTTFESQAERKFNPKVQHFMVTYDELLQKPHRNKALPIRSEPVFIFLPPEGFQLKSFAKTLKKVANEMEKNSGKGYRIAKSEDEYSNFVYGQKMPVSVAKKRDL